MYNPDPITPHSKIVERIDTDKDGFVNHAELHYWIKHRQRRYIEENVNKHWNDYDMNHDGKIGWEEYKNTTYGYYLGNMRKMCLDSDASYCSSFVPSLALTCFF